MNTFFSIILGLMVIGLICGVVLGYQALTQPDFELEFSNPFLIGAAIGLAAFVAGDELLDELKSPRGARLFPEAHRELMQGFAHPVQGKGSHPVNDAKRAGGTGRASQNARRTMDNAVQMSESARLATESAMRAAEDARLCATGIEFGGYSGDPGLNPGMQSVMDDQRRYSGQDSSFSASTDAGSSMDTWSSTGSGYDPGPDMSWNAGSSMDNWNNGMF